MKFLLAKWVLTGCLVLIATAGFARASNMAVSLDDILLLAQRGMTDQTILVFIQSREIDFVPDSGDIDQLLQAGVSEEVIRYMVQRTAPARTYAGSQITYAGSQITYADTYPAYYYTPYYAGTTGYAGYSIYPYHYFGYRHHGGAHYYPSHYPAALHLANNGHGYSRPTHSGSLTARHGSSAAHLVSSTRHSGSSARHSRSGGIGHGRSASHAGSSGGGHTRSSSAGHSGGHGGGH